MEAENTPTINIPEISELRGIRYLSLQGGGAKGLGHIGSIKALEAHGITQQLEVVAGSSAGGLIAVLLALGCDAKQIQLELESFDFEGLTDRSIPSWLDMLFQYSSLQKDKDFFNETTAGDLEPAKKIKNTIKNVDAFFELVFGGNLAAYEGDRIFELLQRMTWRYSGNPNLTFAELSMLAKEHGPPFRELVLTGSNITTKELQYFSAETTPNMPIALAARISASFPGAFKPVTYNGEVFVDGGLKENLPDIFNQPKYLERSRVNEHGGNAQAFALSYLESNGEPAKGKTLKDFLLKLYKTKFSEKKLKEKYGNNIVFIDPVGVDTLNFDLSKKQMQALIASGEKAVYESIKKTLENESSKKEYSRFTDKELVYFHMLLSEKEHLTEEDNITLIAIHDALMKKNVSKERQELLIKQQRPFRVEQQTSIQSQLKACSRRLDEIQKINQELSNQKNQLQLIKVTLLNRNEFILNNFPALSNDLEAIAAHYTQLRSQRARKLAKQESRDFFLSNDFQQAILEKHQNNEAIKSFFETLFKKADNSGIKIPVDLKEATTFLANETDELEALLSEVEKELGSADQEEKLLKNHIKTLEFSQKDQGDNFNRYENLFYIKEKIDESLYRKTSLLSRANQYLYSQTPTVWYLTKPILHLAGNIIFLASLPAKIVSEAINAYQTVDPFWETFCHSLKTLGPEDLTKSLYLSEFQALNKVFFEKISESYSKADKSELEYLYQLYVARLETLGISTEEMLSKHKGESKQSYCFRIEDLEARLNAIKETTLNHQYEKAPTWLTKQINIPEGLKSHKVLQFSKESPKKKSPIKPPHRRT